MRVDSQTEGPKLPEGLSKLIGLAPEGVFATLTEFAGSIGFRVELPETLESGANGDTTHSLGRIRVVASNSEVQQVKTLAHEIGHALLHDPEVPATKELTRGLMELEAESTAYVICAALGMDTSDYSFGYVAGWAGGAPAAVHGIKASTSRIQRATSAVLRNFEAEERTANVASAVSIEVAAGRSVDMDTMLRNGERRIEDPVELERDVTPRVESADVDRTQPYQPLSATELKALDSVAHLNFDAGFGGRL